MSRISERIARLEVDRSPDRVRYIVSDRPHSDEEWEATKGSEDYSGPDAPDQIPTEAEWIARFCFEK